MESTGDFWILSSDVTLAPGPESSHEVFLRSGVEHLYGPIVLHHGTHPKTQCLESQRRENLRLSEKHVRKISSKAIFKGGFIWDCKGATK